MAELPPLVPDDAFAGLPKRLRSELLDAFGKIVQNYAERRWEPAELNGGKLCEVAYSIVKGMADGKPPARASKPKNMVDACKKIEQSSSLPRSLRIQIPRMIVALYEVRNNRNVGHVGGEVDPNHMDAVCVLQMSKWIVAELIRVLHERPLDEVRRDRRRPGRTRNSTHLEGQRQNVSARREALYERQGVAAFARYGWSDGRS